jgi:hypothetical protein
VSKVQRPLNLGLRISPELVVSGFLELNHYITDNKASSEALFKIHLKLSSELPSDGSIIIYFTGL